MAHNYTISFRSLRSATTDAPYVVTIGGGTESTIALKPAASPFVTEEGDDEDVFCPVRTQTGYIRIVDDGLDANGNAFDWKDLVPLTDTARPVTLSQGGTVLWQGFMQSQNFGATLYGNPQEREYPIQCPLASAAGENIVLATSPVTEMKNFAYYLKSILDYIVSVSNGAISFDYVYLQGGTTMQSNMLCLIDPQCFVELDKDKNTISAKYNKYDVLEDICRYWGLTARVHGRSVYLCAPNTESAFIKMSASGTNNDLERMAGGTAAGTSVNVQSVTIPNVFASMDNDVTLQRGYSKATVKGDAGNADKEIIKCYPQYIIDHMTAAQSGDTWDAGGDKAFWYDRKATSIDGIDMTGTANGTSLFATGWVVDTFPFDFNSNTTSIVQCNGIYNGSVKVRIATKFEHNFQGLYFTMNAETIFAGYKLDFTSSDHEYGDKKMYVRIGIEKTRGGTTTRKYFTGTTWSNTETAIQMTIGNKGKSIYYVYNSGGTDYYETKIPVPFGAGYFGKLFVEFLGTNDPTASIAVVSFYDFALTDLTIDMAYHGSLSFVESKNDKTTYKYTAENNNACIEVWNADCIFCSYGKVKFGYGIYFAADGSDQPNEQEALLANRVGGQSTGYWRQSKLMYRTELLAIDQYVAALTPQYEATIDGVACYPVAIGRDWRDDVAKVIFLQK